MKNIEHCVRNVEKERGFNMYFVSYAYRFSSDNNWEFRHVFTDDHPLIWLKKREAEQAEIKRLSPKWSTRFYSLINWKVVSQHDVEQYTGKEE